MEKKTTIDVSGKSSEKLEAHSVQDELSALTDDFSLGGSSLGDLVIPVRTVAKPKARRGSGRAAAAAAAAAARPAVAGGRSAAALKRRQPIRKVGHYGELDAARLVQEALEEEKKGKKRGTPSIKVAHHKSSSMSMKTMAAAVQTLTASSPAKKKAAAGGRPAAAAGGGGGGGGGGGRPGGAPGGAAGGPVAAPADKDRDPAAAAAEAELKASAAAILGRVAALTSPYSGLRTGPDGKVALAPPGGEDAPVAGLMGAVKAAMSLLLVSERSTAEKTKELQRVKEWFGEMKLDRVLQESELYQQVLNDEAEEESTREQRILNMAQKSSSHQDTGSGLEEYKAAAEKAANAALTATQDAAGEVAALVAAGADRAGAIARALEELFREQRRRFVEEIERGRQLDPEFAEGLAQLGVAVPDSVVALRGPELAQQLARVVESLKQDIKVAEMRGINSQKKVLEEERVAYLRAVEEFNYKVLELGAQLEHAEGKNRYMEQMLRGGGMEMQFELRKSENGGAAHKELTKLTKGRYEKLAQQCEDLGRRLRDKEYELKQYKINAEYYREQREADLRQAHDQIAELTVAKRQHEARGDDAAEELKGAHLKEVLALRDAKNRAAAAHDRRAAELGAALAEARAARDAEAQAARALEVEVPALRARNAELERLQQAGQAALSGQLREAAAAAAAAEARRDELEEERGRMREAAAAQAEALQALRRELRELGGEAQAGRAAAAAAAGEGDRAAAGLREEAERLRKEARRREKELDRLEAKLEAGAQARAALEEENGRLAEAARGREGLARELEATRKKLAKFEGRRQTRSNLPSDEEMEALRDAQKNAEVLMQAGRVKDQKVQQLEGEIQNMQRQMEEMKAAVNTKARAEEEAQKYRLQVKQKEEEVKLLAKQSKGQLMRVAGDLRRQEKRAGSAERALAGLRGEAERALQEHHRLKAQAQGLRRALQEKDHELRAATKILEAVVEEGELTEGHLGELRALLARLEVREDDIRQDRLRRAMAKLEQDRRERALKTLQMMFRPATREVTRHDPSLKWWTLERKKKFWEIGEEQLKIKKEKAKETRKQLEKVVARGEAPAGEELGDGSRTSLGGGDATGRSDSSVDRLVALKDAHLAELGARLEGAAGELKRVKGEHGRALVQVREMEKELVFYRSMMKDVKQKQRRGSSITQSIFQVLDEKAYAKVKELEKEDQYLERMARRHSIRLETMKRDSEDSAGQGQRGGGRGSAASKVLAPTEASAQRARRPDDGGGGDGAPIPEVERAAAAAAALAEPAEPLPAGPGGEGEEAGGGGGARPETAAAAAAGGGERRRKRSEGVAELARRASAEGRRLSRDFLEGEARQLELEGELERLHAARDAAAVRAAAAAGPPPAPPEAAEARALAAAAAANAAERASLGRREAAEAQAQAGSTAREEALAALKKEMALTRQEAAAATAMEQEHARRLRAAGEAGARRAAARRRRREATLGEANLSKEEMAKNLKEIEDQEKAECEAFSKEVAHQKEVFSKLVEKRDQFVAESKKRRQYEEAELRQRGLDEVEVRQKLLVAQNRDAEALQEFERNLVIQRQEAIAEEVKKLEAARLGAQDDALAAKLLMLKAQQQQNTFEKAVKLEKKKAKEEEEEKLERQIQMLREQHEKEKKQWEEEARAKSAQAREAARVAHPWGAAVRTGRRGSTQEGRVEAAAVQRRASSSRGGGGGSGGGGTTGSNEQRPTAVSGKGEQAAAEETAEEKPRLSEDAKAAAEAAAKAAREAARAEQALRDEAYEQQLAQLAQQLDAARRAGAAHSAVAGASEWDVGNAAADQMRIFELEKSLETERLAQAAKEKEMQEEAERLRKEVEANKNNIENMKKLVEEKEKEIPWEVLRSLETAHAEELRRAEAQGRDLQARLEAEQEKARPNQALLARLQQEHTEQLEEVQRQKELTVLSLEDKVREETAAAEEKAARLLDLQAQVADRAAWRAQLLAVQQQAEAAPAPAPPSSEAAGEEDDGRSSASPVPADSESDEEEEEEEEPSSGAAAGLALPEDNLGEGGGEEGEGLLGEDQFDDFLTEYKIETRELGVQVDAEDIEAAGRGGGGGGGGAMDDSRASTKSEPGGGGFEARVVAQLEAVVFCRDEARVREVLAAAERAADRALAEEEGAAAAGGKEGGGGGGKEEEEGGGAAGAAAAATPRARFKALARRFRGGARDALEAAAARGGAAALGAARAAAARRGRIDAHSARLRAQGEALEFLLLTRDQADASLRLAQLRVFLRRARRLREEEPEAPCRLDNLAEAALAGEAATLGGALFAGGYDTQALRARVRARAEEARVRRRGAGKKDAELTAQEEILWEQEKLLLQAIEKAGGWRGALFLDNGLPDLDLDLQVWPLEDQVAMLGAIRDHLSLQLDQARDEVSQVKRKQRNVLGAQEQKMLKELEVRVGELHQLAARRFSPYAGQSGAAVLATSREDHLLAAAGGYGRQGSAASSLSHSRRGSMTSGHRRDSSMSGLNEEGQNLVASNQVGPILSYLTKILGTLQSVMVEVEEVMVKHESGGSGGTAPEEGSVLPLSPLAEASAGGSFPPVPSEDRSTQTDEEETGVVLAERMEQTVAAMAGEIQAREAALSALREGAEEARGLRAALGELGGRHARLEDRLAGLARDKSQLEEELRAVQLQKLEEGLRLKEIEDRLLRNPDLQSKNALTFLRGIKKKRLARFEGRLGLLRAERARHFEKVAEAYRFAYHVPQVTFNGKAYASILAFAEAVRPGREGGGGGGGGPIGVDGRGLAGLGGGAASRRSTTNGGGASGGWAPHHPPRVAAAAAAASRRTSLVGVGVGPPTARDPAAATAAAQGQGGGMRVEPSLSYAHHHQRTPSTLMSPASGFVSRRSSLVEPAHGEGKVSLGKMHSPIVAYRHQSDFNRQRDQIYGHHPEIKNPYVLSAEEKTIVEKSSSEEITLPQILPSITVSSKVSSVTGDEEAGGMDRSRGLHSFSWAADSDDNDSTADAAAPPRHRFSEVGSRTIGGKLVKKKYHAIKKRNSLGALPGHDADLSCLVQAKSASAARSRSTAGLPDVATKSSSRGKSQERGSRRPQKKKAAGVGKKLMKLSNDELHHMRGLEGGGVVVQQERVGGGLYISARPPKSSGAEGDSVETGLATDMPMAHKQWKPRGLMERR